MIFAIRYGFRMQCGVHTTTSNQVISELSMSFVITPGQNLQVDIDLSLITRNVHRYYINVLYETR